MKTTAARGDRELTVNSRRMGRQAKLAVEVTVCASKNQPTMLVTYTDYGFWVGGLCCLFTPCAMANLLEEVDILNSFLPTPMQNASLGRHIILLVFKYSLMTIIFVLDVQEDTQTALGNLYKNFTLTTILDLSAGLVKLVCLALKNISLDSSYSTSSRDLIVSSKKTVAFYKDMVKGKFR